MFSNIFKFNFRITIALKQTKPSMIYMPKRNVCLLILGTMPPKLILVSIISKVLIMKNCKILVKVWEKCLRHMASILQQFHAIYKELERWQKYEESLMSPLGIKNLRYMKSLNVCVTPMIPFLNILSLVTKRGSFIIIENKLVNSFDCDESPKHFLKLKLHQKKIMVTFWWTTISIIHVSFLETNQNITAINLQTCILPCKTKACLVEFDVIQFCFTTMCGEILQDWLCRNSQTWDTKLYHILHLLQAYWLHRGTK